MIWPTISWTWARGRIRLSTDAWWSQLEMRMWRVAQAGAPY